MNTLLEALRLAKPVVDMAMDDPTYQWMPEVEKAQEVVNAVLATNGWLPISEAPQHADEWEVYGMWKRGKWRRAWSSFRDSAIADGYTHWLPMPTPQEVGDEHSK